MVGNRKWAPEMRRHLGSWRGQYSDEEATCTRASSLEDSPGIAKVYTKQTKGAGVWLSSTVPAWLRVQCPAPNTSLQAWLTQTPCCHVTWPASSLVLSSSADILQLSSARMVGSKLTVWRWRIGLRAPKSLQI